MCWNRFDICEAWSCLAHDWGLYALNTRLDQAGFRPHPDLTVDTLEENARAIYDHWDHLFSKDPKQVDPYAPRPMATFNKRNPKL